MGAESTLTSPQGTTHGQVPRPGLAVPVPYRVVERRVETQDVTTVSLAPLGEAIPAFRAGQFNMLTAFGIGEAAISVSGIPGEGTTLHHTVRDVGPVTHALCSAGIGDVVGVRGPFGTDWGTANGGPDDRARPNDHIGETAARSGVTFVVAGGIGLAPLRGAIYELLAGGRAGATPRQVVVVVGAREPAQLMYRDDLRAWEAAGARVLITVDVPAPGWTGHVGLVTSLLGSVEFPVERARAFICGPEIMMRFTVRALLGLGVAEERIWVSLERNMQCGVAWCGHCQLGPLLLCRDGPIVAYAGVVSQLLTQRER